MVSGAVRKVRGSSMKIKQVEELVGITRKNIRFYEEQKTDTGNTIRQMSFDFRKSNCSARWIFP